MTKRLSEVLLEQAERVLGDEYHFVNRAPGMPGAGLECCLVAYSTDRGSQYPGIAVIHDIDGVSEAIAEVIEDNYPRQWRFVCSETDGLGEQLTKWSDHFGTVADVSAVLVVASARAAARGE